MISVVKSQMTIHGLSADALTCNVPQPVHDGRHFLVASCGGPADEPAVTREIHSHFCKIFQYSGKIWSF